MTPYFEKTLCNTEKGDLFDKVFYIDIYRAFFTVLLMLLLLSLNVITVAVS